MSARSPTSPPPHPDANASMLNMPATTSADVFHFGDKTLATRLQECQDVLQYNRPVPASRVRSEWSYFMELQIEPAGWQALWRIPRIICESFQIAYPTVVSGTVEAVAFEQLRAHLLVTGVQDADAVRLPERHEVALIDLMPLREQENDALNVEATARSVDLLRFFYQHVWRPWDNDGDDDLDWATLHLERRIRFHCDLLARRISRPLAVHIRALLAEAQDVQQRREYLELDISDDEDVNETQHKSEITDLMRLHLRLANIRSELEILENPEMRNIYEDVRRRNSVVDGVATGGALIVSHIGTLSEQRQHLDWCERYVGASAQVRIMPTLQHCLATCLDGVTVCLPTGRHAIMFQEPLQGKLMFVGQQKSEHADGVDAAAEQNTSGGSTVICASDDNGKLLTVDGDMRFDGVTFDCSRVRVGIVVRRGRLELRNCHFVGVAESNTKCAISVASSPSSTTPSVKTSVELIDCTVRNFAVGLALAGSNGGDSGGAIQVLLQSTRIFACDTAVECASSSQCNVSLVDGTQIGPNRRFGCAVTLGETVDGVPSKQVFTNIAEAEPAGCLIGNGTFVDNALGNIVLYKYNANNLFEEIDESIEQVPVKNVSDDDSDIVVDSLDDNDAEFAMPLSPKRLKPADDVAEVSSGSESGDIFVYDSESDLSSSVIVVDDSMVARNY